MATEEEIKILRSLVEKYPDGQGWEEAWKTNVTPWDKLGTVQPPLRELLQSKQQDWPRQGRALVPGCGRGYDAIFIASTLGLDTLGLDISSTALQSAHSLLASSPDPSPGKVTFQTADFFSLSVPEDERFDLVYDYTFFVAIPPSKRPEWGRQMNALVKSGGFLITLIFPINPFTEKGPPFFLRPEHYVELLEANWEKVIDRVPAESQGSHIGHEHLVVWKKL